MSSMGNTTNNNFGGGINMNNMNNMGGGMGMLGNQN